MLLATPPLFSESSRQEYVADPIFTQWSEAAFPCHHRAWSVVATDPCHHRAWSVVGLPRMIVGLMNDWFWYQSVTLSPACGLTKFSVKVADAPVRPVVLHVTVMPGVPIH